MCEIQCGGENVSDRFEERKMTGGGGGRELIQSLFHHDRLILMRSRTSANRLSPPRLPGHSFPPFLLPSLILTPLFHSISLPIYPITACACVCACGAHTLVQSRLLGEEEEEERSTDGGRGDSGRCVPAFPTFPETHECSAPSDGWMAFSQQAAFCSSTFTLAQTEVPPPPGRSPGGSSSEDLWKEPPPPTDVPQD